MAQRAKRLWAPFQAANAAGAASYTATNVRCVVQSITGCNSTGTARLVTAHLVVSGGAVAASNMIISARTILPGQALELLDRPKVLENGDFIVVFADAATAVTMHASGVETDV